METFRITDSDTYITSIGRAQRSISYKLCNIFGRCNFIFYPQMFWIIWIASRKAVKGVYGSHELIKSSLNTLRLLEDIGVRFEITGMENLKKVDGSVIFISNHMSTLETFILPSIIGSIKPITFVVKKSLIKMPVFGHIMRSLETIVLERMNPKEDLKIVMEEGVKRLHRGKSIIIFPQSTRSVIFNPHEFNSLGIKLALRSGADIIPIALKTDAWRIGRFIKDFGSIDRNKTVYFAFGEPMKITGRGTDEHEKTIHFIKDKLEKWSKKDE